MLQIFVFRATEASQNPLQQQLKDVESQIQDKEDAIAITRMSILRHQERIDKILSGLDQVQSTRGKIPLPSKDEFLSYAQTRNQPVQKAVFSGMPSSSFAFDRDDEEPSMSRASSGFGSALSRLARAGGGGLTGMKPIFQADDEDDEDDDLDPDKFDPWKA
jgi:hypothetical protein